MFSFSKNDANKCEKMNNGEKIHHNDNKNQNHNFFFFFFMSVCDVQEIGNKKRSFLSFAEQQLRYSDCKSSFSCVFNSEQQADVVLYSLLLPHRFKLICNLLSIFCECLASCLTCGFDKMMPSVSRSVFCNHKDTLRVGCGCCTEECCCVCRQRPPPSLVPH